MKNPSKRLVWKLVDEGGIWDELGLEQDEKLNYNQGSIELNTCICDIEKKFEEIKGNKNYAKNDTDFKTIFPLNAKCEGGYAIIGKDTIYLSKNRKKGQGRSSKRRYGGGFDSGHILARQLVRNEENGQNKGRGIIINYNNFHNIYPQTPWSNKGSAPKKSERGEKKENEEVRNQTYFENLLVNYIQDKSEELFYRVKLVYGKDASELVPRGARIQAIKIIQFNDKKVLGENLFNVFIPNVTETCLIDYTNRDNLTEVSP